MKNVRALKNLHKIIVVVIVGFVLLSGMILFLVYGIPYSFHNQTINGFRKTAIEYVRKTYGDHYVITRETPYYDSPVGVVSAIRCVYFNFSDTNEYDFDFLIEVNSRGVRDTNYAYVNDPIRRKDAEDYVKEKYGDHYKITHQRIENFSTLKQYLLIVYYYFCDVNDENVTFTVEWDSDPGGVVSDTFEK